MKKETTLLIITLLAMTIPYTSISSFPTEKDENKSLEKDNWWEYGSNDKNHNKIHDNIDKMINNEDPDQKISIHISYDHRPNQGDIDQLTKFDFTIDYVAKYTNQILVNDICLKDVKKVANLKGVVMVIAQTMMRPMLDIASPAVKARDSFEYSPKTAWEIGYTGKGVNIAIIDTGVDDEHESLSGKFVAGIEIRTPLEMEGNPDDTNGHGTHCAGIAMGVGGTTGKYKGAAPDAGLIDIKTSSNTPKYNGGNVIKGIEWCIEHKEEYNIRIISISSGGSGDDNGTGPGCEEVNAAADNGIVVTVCIGNDGPDNEGIPPPASADKAIVVGAIRDRDTINRDDDEIVSYSSRGPRKDDKDIDPYDELKPDVVAPGINIISARAAIVEGDMASDDYISMDGTSMATPMVAGIIALMLEANPDLRPEDVKQILHETAEARGEASIPHLSDKYNIAYGYGIVDAYEAVKMAESYEVPTDGNNGVSSHSIEPVTLNPPISITENSMELCWGASLDHNFTRYELHKSNSENFDPSTSTLVHTINDRLMTSYKVTGLEEGTTYYFKIRIYGIDGQYADSNEVHATTSTKPTTEPDSSWTDELILPIAVVSFFVVIVLIIALIYLKMRRKRRFVE